MTQMAQREKSWEEFCGAWEGKSNTPQASNTVPSWVYLMSAGDWLADFWMRMLELEQLCP